MYKKKASGNFFAANINPLDPFTFQSRKMILMISSQCGLYAVRNKYDDNDNKNEIANNDNTDNNSNNNRNNNTILTCHLFANQKLKNKQLWLLPNFVSYAK